MSKFKQRHLLEDGYWVIEFKPNGPKIQYACLELESGGVILSAVPWTEELIRKAIARDEGMNEWQWKEVLSDDVAQEDGVDGEDGSDDSGLDGPANFDAHGFYREVEQLVADYGRKPDEPIVSYIESKLNENLTLEDEIEGIQHRLADQKRVEEAISTERLLNTVIDMQDSTLKICRSISGTTSGQLRDVTDMLHRIDQNTDDAEKLSRIAIIVSLFGTLATWGGILIAISMFGAK